MRRLQFLFAGFAWAAAAVPQPEKYYVTGGRRVDPKQNDLNVSPLICYGSSRLDALTHAGLTVWTEAEWESAQEILKRVPRKENP